MALIGALLGLGAGACDAAPPCLPTDGGAAGAGGAGSPDTALLGAPFLFAPSSHGCGISVVLEKGHPAALRARVRPDGATAWGAPRAPAMRALDLAEWKIDGLSAGARYRYEIVAGPEESAAVLYEGAFMTGRPSGAPFSFALVSDTHIGASPLYTNQGDPDTLAGVSAQIQAIAPDFVVNLGDVLDYHEYGFNDPPPDSSIARLAYLNYRTTLGDLTGHTPHFGVLGGWDSENGFYTPAEIERSRSQRLLYAPGPQPATYPQGGSAFEDYYAFTWGDALFVVLNVYTYTPTPHLLDQNPGRPDDWTLGAAQLDWLRQTLAAASSKWRFLLIHHPVGGAAGDPSDTAYGRGGGQAAYVGEQATVHALMRQYGVQVMFYGHDHVFTDMVVDGIHYTLPGSAGAPWMFGQDQTGYTTSWSDSGWGRVDVTADSVAVHFLSISGQSLYDFEIP